MLLRESYISTLISVLLSAFALELVAQSNSTIINSTPWFMNEGGTLDADNVLMAIELLKSAEATIFDSATAAQLNRIGYLAIVQSGFMGSAQHENHRGGWWMLSYPIAIKYGLKVNKIIDERRNLVKSSQAAFHYRSDLYAQFGSDEIADLVFVQSPIAIGKYLIDSINYPSQFEMIKESKKSIKEIKEEYLRHRTTFPVGTVQSVVEVRSSAPISFEVIHHFLQIPTASLKELNSEWVANYYDPIYGGLHLPASYVEEFEKLREVMEQKTSDDEIALAALNIKRINQLKGDIPDLRTYKPISYKVKMGDNMGQIAQRYHVKISSLRAWNGIKNDRIYAGQRMTIYVPINQKVVAPKPVVSQPATTTLESGKYQEYTVQSGDTLWSISKKYEHVSIENIMADNGVDEHIAPGQVLKIRMK